ncbi:hypothetical protein SUDANB120_04314 [Streptomyces sp. enrichment culture]
MEASRRLSVGTSLQAGRRVSGAERIQPEPITGVLLLRRLVRTCLSGSSAVRPTVRRPPPTGMPPSSSLARPVPSAADGPTGGPVEHGEAADAVADRDPADRPGGQAGTGPVRAGPSSRSIRRRQPRAPTVAGAGCNVVGGLPGRPAGPAWPSDRRRRTRGWAAGRDAPVLHPHELRPPGENTLGQDPPAVNGQSGAAVGHEDLRERCSTDTCTAPEVFAVIRTDRRRQRFGSIPPGPVRPRTGAQSRSPPGTHRTSPTSLLAARARMNRRSERRLR